MEPMSLESEPQPHHADVYERLYDPRSYTGVYRKRFELDTRDLTETVVHDLSNTIRTNLNHDVDPKTKRPVSPRMSLSGQSLSLNLDATATTKRSPDKVPCPSPIQLHGDPNDPHTLLKAVFHYYCRFGRTGARGALEKTMDNANFSKLCRESPDLLDVVFTTTDVDLIFVKAKKKGERRINYARFLDALGMIAVQKYPDAALEESVPMILQMHIARLPCVLELTDSRSIHAIWQRRLDRIDSETSDPPSPPPASRRASSPSRSGDLDPATGEITQPPPAPMGPDSRGSSPSRSPQSRRISAPMFSPMSSSYPDDFTGFAAISSAGNGHNDRTTSPHKLTANRHEQVITDTGGLDGDKAPYSTPVLLDEV